MSKYGYSVIWKKLPIDLNLLDNKEMNYNYLTDDAFFNLKKKFLCHDEFGLFCGLYILIMDIIDLEEKNKFFKKIKIKNKYFLKKKDLSNLMKDENFLNFCDEFFTNYYFDYSEYKIYLIIIL